MTDIKKFAGLVTMIMFSVMTFFTKDFINSELFAALSIIIGANIFRQISNQKIRNNEKHKGIETN